MRNDIIEQQIERLSSSPTAGKARRITKETSNQGVWIANESRVQRLQPNSAQDDK